MSLKTRSNDIKKQIDLVNGYCVDDRYRKVIGMRSSTNNRVNYHSELTTDNFIRYIHGRKYKVVKVSCKRVESPDMKVCEGSRQTICKHCAAAFLWSNRRKNRLAELFDTLAEVNGKGGTLVKLVSGDKVGWAVITDNRTPTYKFRDRVNLLRGEKEKGIY